MLQSNTTLANLKTYLRGAPRGHASGNEMFGIESLVPNIAKKIKVPQCKASGNKTQLLLCTSGHGMGKSVLVSYIQSLLIQGGFCAIQLPDFSSPSSTIEAINKVPVEDLDLLASLVVAMSIESKKALTIYEVVQEFRKGRRANFQLTKPDLIVYLYDEASSLSDEKFRGRLGSPSASTRFARSEPCNTPASEIFFFEHQDPILGQPPFPLIACTAAPVEK